MDAQRPSPRPVRGRFGWDDLNTVLAVARLDQPQLVLEARARYPQGGDALGLLHLQEGMDPFLGGIGEVQHVTPV